MPDESRGAVDGPGAPETVSPAPAGSPLARIFQAFRYRDFRLLWAGAFTSTTGTWMQTVAQSWVVLELTGSAFYLGLIGFLSQLPIILFTLVGGAFADQLDRRKVLIFSQVVQMAAAFVLTILLYFEWIEIWHFLAMAFLAGSGQAFGGPAYMALIPGLVEREDVPNAIALNSIQFNLARVVGPLVAGVALASLGAVFCFGLNGVSFLAVIASLLVIGTRFRPAETHGSVLLRIKKGFQYVQAQGDLWQLTILGFVSAFCGVPLLTLLPVFARDVFGLGASGYSTLMAVSGAGAIAGALFYAGYSRMKRRGLFTLQVQVVFALLLCLFAFSTSLIFSVVLLFLSGVCLISLFASINSLVQLATTEQMRGRVMSIFMLAFRGGMPLGDLTAGYIAHRVSPAIAVLGLGLVLGGVGVAVLASSSSIKRL